MCAMIYCGFCTFDMTSLIPEDKLLIMTESTLSAKVEPYQFEPTTVACYSDEDITQMNQTLMCENR